MRVINGTEKYLLNVAMPNACHSDQRISIVRNQIDYENSEVKGCSVDPTEVTVSFKNGKRFEFNFEKGWTKKWENGVQYQ